MSSSTKTGIHPIGHSKIVVNLGPSGYENQFISDPLFFTELVNLSHSFDVYVVMRNNHTRQNCIRSGFYCSIDQFVDRDAGSQIGITEPEFLDSAMFDIQDLSHPDGVFVVSNCAGDNMNRMLIKIFSYLIG